MKVNNSALPAHVHFAFVRLFVAGAETGRSYTAGEVAARFEIASSTACKWVKVLRECDLIYVKTWRRAGSAWVACYAWGFKEDDTPKPTPLTQKEHERNYHERKRRLRESPMTVSPMTAMVRHLT